MLDLAKPQVMGILNLTPDSFSDGGRFTRLDSALDHARRMVEEGAGIIDVGGESTRPGAQTVSESEELQRVIPVIEKLIGELDVPVSIDTSKPEVMRAAVAAGAGMINDVMALQAPGALQAAVASKVPVCLMHMRGQPRTMQLAPSYRDVVEEVREFFDTRITACTEAGIARKHLLIDPGFGFGKSLEHNLALLRHLDEFQACGVPILVGLSRKSMIGALLGDRPVDGRLFGSVAAAVIAYLMGASIIRVHDVGATVDALKVAAATV